MAEVSTDTVTVSHKLLTLESQVTELRGQMDILLSWIVPRFSNESGFPTEEFQQVSHYQSNSKGEDSTMDEQFGNIEPEVIIKEEPGSELKYHSESGQFSTGLGAGGGGLVLETETGNYYEEEDEDDEDDSFEDSENEGENYNDVSAPAPGRARGNVQTSGNGHHKNLPSSSSTPSTISNISTTRNPNPRPSITTTDTDSELHQCTICGKSFRRRYNLTIHLKLHTDLHQFKCFTCGENFTNITKSEFSRHEYECTNAVTQTNAKSNNIIKIPQNSASADTKPLTRHQQLILAKATIAENKNLAPTPRPRPASRNPEFRPIPNGNGGTSVQAQGGKYPCEVCGKGFGRRDHMIRHQKIHTGLKPFLCTICGNSYGRRDQLTTHYRKRHQININGSGNVNSLVPVLSQSSCSTASMAMDMENEEVDGEGNLEQYEEEEVEEECISID